MDTSRQSKSTAAQWAIPVAEESIHAKLGRFVPAEVLVAEDDDDMRRLVVQALRAEGFHVVSASSGWELLKHIGSRMLARDGRPIGLIVTDVRMHGVTGLEILAGLRENDWSTPLILMTAFGDAELHAEAERLGALAVLDKPFELAALRELVRRWARS
jgi:DNA-binding NtrC family response regulator